MKKYRLAQNCEHIARNERNVEDVEEYPNLTSKPQQYRVNILTFLRPSSSRGGSVESDGDPSLVEEGL